MKEFNFEKDRNPMHVVRIEGKEYAFHPLSYQCKHAIDTYTKKIAPLIERLKQSDEIDEAECIAINMQGCEIAKETINGILKENAFDEIFRERTMDFGETQQVLNFLFDEVIAYSKGKLNEHEHTAG